MMSRSEGRRRRQPAIGNQDEPMVPLQEVNWRRLLGYLRPYAGRMALAIAALLVTSGLGLVFPLVIVKLLESVTQVKSLGPLNTLAGLLVGLFLLQAVFSFVQSYLLTYIGEHIVYDLRTS